MGSNMTKEQQAMVDRSSETDNKPDDNNQEPTKPEESVDVSGGVEKVTGGNDFTGGAGAAMRNFLANHPADEEEKPTPVVVDVEEEKPTEEEKPAEPEPVVLEKLEAKDLIEMIKERDTQISSGKEELSKLKLQADSVVTDVEYKADMESLSTDFLGNYGKLREKYKLPALETLKDMVSEGDPNLKLKEWQEANLRKEIEDKHGLLDGEFEYDPSEAAKVGTPSNDWDSLTEAKRKEIFGSYKERQENDQANLQKVKAQQELDIKWLSETYFGSEEETVKRIDAVSEISRKIAVGDEDPSNHPFGIRNLVRGVFYEEMSKDRADKAVATVMEQFAKHQMYLPDIEMPTDVTDIKARGREEEKKTFVDVKQNEFSPMYRSIARELK